MLEWRVAPTSKARSPHLDGTEQLVLVCDHGYASILAAATLVDLGRNAADVIGGFEAWLRAGLPVTLARDPTPHVASSGPHD